MESAIIAGTGVYNLPGFEFEKQVVETVYGSALVNVGRKDGFELAFLARHGLDHTTPPHKINYKANIMALHQLGIKQVIAIYAVGSINRAIPPAGMAVLSDLLDFTSGRPLSFYEGGKSGLAHTSMDEPYCPVLSQRLLQLAPEYGLTLHPGAVYVCTNGPRLETPAEIRMFAGLGGDVVGMTGQPEATLARELKIHFAAVAYSINWAAGLEKSIQFVGEGMEEAKKNLSLLLIRTLQENPEKSCNCENAVMFMHMPEKE